MRRPFQHLLTAALGALLALLAAEGLSRIVPPRPEPPTKIYDPRIGYRLRPGMRGTWTVENAGRFSFNANGFRDVEWTEARGTRRRVAVLGDSFAEALQVDLERSFPKLIERLLPDTEVMNFGISGQGQVEELLTYRAYVRTFRPDLVVLAFYPGNDPLENWRRSRPSPRFPVFAAPTATGVDLVPVPAAGRLAWLRRAVDLALTHSSLARRLMKARTALFRRGAGGVGLAGRWEGAFGNPGGTVPDFDAMWGLTEKLVRQLRDDVAADTGRPDGLVVACLSEGVQVHRAQRERFVTDHPGFDPDYAQTRMRAFCVANGIPFVALAPEMIRLHESGGALLHGFDGSGDGHYNEEGHRVAAEAIAGRIEPLLP